MLGVALEGALYWAWPGGGSKLGMDREGALNWAWTGRGLYIGHGPGGGSI